MSIESVSCRKAFHGLICMNLGSGNSERFILGCSKINADGDFSHEVKRPLLLGRKAMINLDSALKTKEIILLKKVHIVKAMVFQ